jgi:ribonuclease P/MRP protein subunit POP1
MSAGPSVSSGAAHARSLPGAHGWTLLAPAGWGMPFLSALLHTGARMGGLAEQAQHALAAGAPAFPADGVGTDAHADEVEEEGAQARERWERTPPAKRVNYEKRGVEEPWIPDWRALCGLPPLDEQQDEEDLLPAQREPPTNLDAMEIDAVSATLPVPPADAPDAPEDPFFEPWLLRGSDMSALLASLAKTMTPAPSLLAALNASRAKRGISPIGPDAVHGVWRAGLVRVRLEMFGRGKPGPGAQVFIIDDKEGMRWRRLFVRHSTSKNQTEHEEGEESADEKAVRISSERYPQVLMDKVQLAALSPAAGGLAGFVTSGNFALAVGQAHAIAAMPLARWYALIQQTQRYVSHSSHGLSADSVTSLEGMSASVPLVKVRDRDGLVCRAARMYVLQD